MTTIDQEFGANLAVKEALLAEAQALLPVNDLAAAKKSLQSIRDRWEEAGKVPRGDMQPDRRRAAQGRGRRQPRRGRQLAAVQPGDQGPHQQRTDPAGVRHRRARG